MAQPHKRPAHLSLTSTRNCSRRSTLHHMGWASTADIVGRARGALASMAAIRLSASGWPCACVQREGKSQQEPVQAECPTPQPLSRHPPSTPAALLQPHLQRPQGRPPPQDICVPLIVIPKGVLPASGAVEEHAAEGKDVHRARLARQLAVLDDQLLGRLPAGAAACGLREWVGVRV